MPLSVAADEITSRYSDLDLKKCQKLALFEDEGEGGEWSCPGIEDYDVRVWEGDLRSYVAFGTTAPAQCASMQTFGGFNSLGPRVEWRMKDGKPFATILRWFTRQNTDQWRWHQAELAGRHQARRQGCLPHRLCRHTLCGGERGGAPARR